MPAAPTRDSISVAPYESQLVAQFHRELGRIETEQHFHVAQFSKILEKWRAFRAESDKNLKKGLAASAGNLLDNFPAPDDARGLGVLSNAQNPLDHLVGDLVAETSTGRYFIVEFKRYPNGFVDEASLGGGAKLDRVALITHIQTHDRCKELSLLGHFGAYWSASGLCFALYFPLAQGSPATPMTTAELFFEQGPKAFWSSDQFREYLSCMTSHGTSMVNDDGNLVFGYINSDGQVVVMLQPANIFRMVQLALDRADAMRPSPPAARDRSQVPSG